MGKVCGAFRAWPAPECAASRVRRAASPTRRGVHACMHACGTPDHPRERYLSPGVAGRASSSSARRRDREGAGEPAAAPLPSFGAGGAPSSSRAAGTACCGWAGAAGSASGSAASQVGAGSVSLNGFRCLSCGPQPSASASTAGGGERCGDAGVGLATISFRSHSSCSQRSMSPCSARSSAADSPSRRLVPAAGRAEAAAVGYSKAARRVLPGGREGTPSGVERVLPRG
jgi:hypothetical protein